MAETPEHKQLKALALQWAVDQGYKCAGYEISLPHSGYRADVAAYKPDSELQTIEFEGRKLRQRQPIIGSTAVFACKQARADLFKDSCLEAKAQEKLKKLQARRVTIERLLRTYYPFTRIGDSLFEEFQSCDFSATGHKGWAKVVQQIQALQNALLTKNKFERLIRYRFANLLYLVTPDHILKKYELPLGWGNLVKDGEGLKLVQAPSWLDASEGARLGVLQRISLK